MLKNAKVVLIGFASMILFSWASLTAIGHGYTSLAIRLLLDFSIFLFAGIISGVLFREVLPRTGAIFLLIPLASLTLLSIAFSGFIMSFLSNDLPILVLAFVAGSLGFYIGNWVNGGNRPKNAPEDQL